MIPLVFEDKQKCFYLFSVSKRQLLPINELMFLILKYYFEFGNLIIKSDWMNKYDNLFVKKTVEKFLFFRDHHYLDPITVKVDAKINFNNIERPLSNINQICFELTQKCNLSCTYCCYGDLYDHVGNDNNSELNEETALCFLDNLREDLSVQKNELSHRKITIGFYGGEALLKVDVIKRLIHYIDENIKNIPNVFINYIITTNGLLLDKYIDFLVENQFSVMVSLDGNYFNSSYRKMKNGKNSFDTLLSNLHFVKDKYPIYFENNITFNSVIHNRNSVESVVSYIYENFGKIPQLAELSPDLVRKDKMIEFKEMHQDVIIDYNNLKNVLSLKEFFDLNKSFKYVPSFFYRLLNINMRSWSDFFIDYGENVRPSMCEPFSNKLFISAKGELHLCEHIGYSYLLGYVDVHSKKIVFDPTELSLKFSAYLSSMAKECEECADVLTCETCIFQKQLKCKHMTTKEFSSKVAYNMDILREREEILSDIL